MSESIFSPIIEDGIKYKVVAVCTPSRVDSIIKLLGDRPFRLFPFEKKSDVRVCVQEEEIKGN